MDSDTDNTNNLVKRTETNIDWHKWQDYILAVSGNSSLYLTKQPHHFCADVLVYKLQQGLLSHAKTGQYRFERNTLRISQDQLDAIYVQTYIRSNGSNVYNGTHKRTIRTGDVVLLDLAEPFSVDHADHEMINLILPRSLFKKYLIEHRSYPALVFSRTDPVAETISQLLLQLINHIELLSETVITTLIDTIVQLAASKMAPFSQNTPHHYLDSQQLRLLKAQQLIKDNLGHPSLTSTELSQRLNISRTTLFRIFEEVGGIQQYTLDLRMKQAAYLLQKKRPGTIQQIAHKCGFAHPASFSRAFKLYYGISPKEASEPFFAGMHPDTPYHLWFQELRR